MRASPSRAASLPIGILLAAVLMGPAAGAPTASELRARLDAVITNMRGADFRKAIAELEPLIADIAASSDRALLAEALIQRATGQFRSAAYADAYATYQQSLVESRAIGERKHEARALWGMAQVRKDQGRYAEALRLNTDARTLYVAIAERGGEMRAWLLEGALLDLTGEHRNALQSYQRSRALMKEGELNYGLVHSEMAISHKNLGEFEKARELFETAIRIHRGTGWKYGEAMALGGLGSLTATLGDYDAAARKIEEALEILRGVGDLRGQAYAYGSLGDVWWATEDAARATAAYQKQLEMGEKLGMKPSQALALAGLGEIALADGQYALARERFGRSLAIERADGGSREAALLVALATVEWRDGKTDAARPLAQEALRLALDADNPEAHWQSRLALARASSDPAETLAHLRAGVRVVGSLRGRLLTDTGKVGYLDARQELFHELVAVLARESRAMESLEAAEAARGRAFSDLLAARARDSGAGDRSLLTQLREEEARLRKLSQASPDEPELRGELARTRAAAEARIDAQLATMRDQRRELASLVVAEPVSAAEIRATSARLGATIVEYLVTGERLFIWVVGPTQAPFATSVALDRKRLRDTVREVHREFNELDAERLRNPGRARELLRQLHRWVLEPVAARLPRKSADLVLLVPHDALLVVPFAALEDAAGRSVLERHTLVSAPSIAALRYTAQKMQRAKGLEDARLLALADPAGPPDAALEPLPGARAEVRGIRNRFAADRRLALEGAEASESNAKQLSGGQTNLHFAVHGLVRDDRPWDSALVLAPGDGEDGWLRVSEVFDLTLAADLVVLSGCSTGAGRLSGDGILGLGRAFIYAGTPSVLVSQWDVSDVATAFLMERFYAELHAGRSKAQALRAAQLAAQKRFRHPALWAAFVLIGEPT